MPSSQLPQHPSRTGNQFGGMLGIMSSPESVGLVPTLFRDSCPSIDGVPVRRIVLFQFPNPPFQADILEHRQVSLTIRVEGIEQRAVPIKQHTGKLSLSAHPVRVAESSTSLFWRRTSRLRKIDAGSTPSVESQVLFGGKSLSQRVANRESGRRGQTRNRQNLQLFHASQACLPLPSGGPALWRKPRRSHSPMAGSPTQCPAQFRSPGPEI